MCGRLRWLPFASRTSGVGGQTGYTVTDFHSDCEPSVNVRSDAAKADFRISVTKTSHAMCRMRLLTESRHLLSHETTATAVSFGHRSASRIGVPERRRRELAQIQEKQGMPCGMISGRKKNTTRKKKHEKSARVRLKQISIFDLMHFPHPTWDVRY